MNPLLEFVDNAKKNSRSAFTIFKSVCRDVSTKTGSNRVSIWDLDDDESFIKCACYYNAVDETYTDGQKLYTKDHPKYFRTIVEENVIVAPNARTQPVTAEPTDP